MRTVDLAALQHQARDLMLDIARDRQPILVTQGGLPGAYLVDVDGYEALCSTVHVLEGIARGELAVTDGSGDVTRAGRQTPCALARIAPAQRPPEKSPAEAGLFIAAVRGDQCIRMLRNVRTRYWARMLTTANTTNTVSVRRSTGIRP